MAKKNSSTSTTVTSKKKIRTDVPLLQTPEDIDPNAFNVDAQEVDAEQVDLTDANFNLNKIKANKLANRVMTAADYELIDPADVQAEFGDITRSEMRKNQTLASELALDALDTELQGLLNYAPTAANLQRQQVTLDNTLNQSERLRMLDSADSSIRTDLSGQADRARAYAEGRVPDSILDRQLELGVQSKAADRAAFGGFGAGSSAAMKAGQLMSAEARIGLSQYGDQLLTSNLQNRTNTLLAPQQLATGGSQIQVMPSMSAGQAAMAIASEANAGNITARDALQSKTQQGQFKAGLEQEANITNLQTQTQRDLSQAQLDLQADTTNLDADIKTQTFAKEVQSAERRFNAELKTNTNIANADRAFNAANANAGRSLEVATTNRAVKLEVEKTNKTMVFQDQQRKKSEIFQDAQNRAANAAANARAAMSASTQMAAIQAQKEMAAEDRAFQLEQQSKAYEIYKENRKESQDSSNWGAAGTIISRAPTIINGLGSLADTISGWWDDTPTSNYGSEGTGDFTFDSEGQFNYPEFSTEYNTYEGQF